MANDVSADPRYIEAVPGTKAEVVVPIRRKGRVIGALNLLSGNVGDLFVVYNHNAVEPLDAQRFGAEQGAQHLGGNFAAVILRIEDGDAVDRERLPAVRVDLAARAVVGLELGVGQPHLGQELHRRHRDPGRGALLVAQRDGAGELGRGDELAPGDRVGQLGQQHVAAQARVDALYGETPEGRVVMDMLYQRLDQDRRMGRFDRQRLWDNLRLPQRTPLLSYASTTEP